MSRSFRKTPCCHVIKPCGKVKTQYNRKVRRAHFNDIPSGNAYRKLNESWDIAECNNVGTSYARFRDWMIFSGEYSDEKRCKQEYARLYLRK